MNRDVFEGRWSQLRGRVKEAWGALTDDDLDRVGGRVDSLRGLLQERYGWARERAEDEIRRFADRVRDAVGSRPPPDGEARG
jgi:uncharacterized protein YjbJ (UPF0337 family)